MVGTSQPSIQDRRREDVVCQNKDQDNKPMIGDVGRGG